MAGAFAEGGERMTPEEYQRARQLFDAVERLPREFRRAKLVELCPDDPSLRERVVAMLDAESRLVPELQTRMCTALVTQTDDRMGQYRLVRLLGEGGMGDVWLAEQLEPIHRRVALKFVRAGMASQRVLERFEAERQAMSLMDHPTIAHIFEAGVTEQGLPYFAMEYVDGLPITTFCDAHRLTLEERLRLFIRVCEGVQHAHQKAVLHRDLKPSNVLVRMQDGRPAPTIIDFGIAKALRGPLTEWSIQTEFDAFVGTPEYMSPERLSGTGSDADTRADVYALGMILYELLAGALPFDGASLRTGSHEEIRRRIMEQTLIRPSVLLRNSHDASELARKRSTDAARLTSALHGDLDWVVMKAITPEIERRYASVASLAQDLERNLEREPVLARPPDAAYLLTRFIARHRVGVVATMAVVAMVVIGVAGTAAGLVRARKAEAMAQRDAQMAEQSLAFLLGLFSLADPVSGGGMNVTARQLLDIVARQLDADSNLNSATRAQLKQVIGYAYVTASDRVLAEKYLHEALEEQRVLLGAGHPQTLRTLRYLAELHWDVGSLAEAEQFARQAAGGLRDQSGPNDRETMEAEGVLVTVLVGRGRLDEALALAEDLLKRRLAVLGALDPITADSLHLLASVQLLKGDVDAAERVNKEALAIRRARLGLTHMKTFMSELALADVALARGELAAAEITNRRAVALAEERWGPTTKAAYKMHESLGRVLCEEERWLEATRELETALAGYRRLVWPGHPDILKVAHLLGLAQRALGNTAAAQALLHEACEGSRQAFGQTHPQTLESCAAESMSRHSDARGLAAAASSSAAQLQLADGHESR